MSSQTGENSMPRRNWRQFLFRLAASALVLALLFVFLPREQLIGALAGFSVEMWLAGVSVYLCLHLIGVAKWRMLINAAGAGLGFAQVARCYYYGLFGNTFLPSVVGGDVLRTGLAMKLSPSGTAVVAGSVVDRTVDILGLVLVAVAGAALIPAALDEHGRQIFWWIAALAALGGALLAGLFFALPARRFSLKVRRIMVKAKNAAGLLIRRPEKMVLALVSAIVLQTCQVMMNLWLGRLAMIRNATFLMWLFVWPLAKLAAMAPLTQGGIGVREAAQGALFLPFGVSMEKAVAAGLLFQAIVISGNLLGGLVAVLLGQFGGAGPRTAAGTSRPRTARRAGITGALVSGGLLFFVANTLALASGTQSVSMGWIDWMDLLPGYGASFSGGCAGLAYGLVFGYLAGRFAGKIR